MELISRDKLKEVIEPMVGKFDDDGEFWWTRESILRAIDNAPTIEERKEGRWTNVGLMTVRCSNCKSQFHELEAINFCPNCGARMIGE